MHLLVTSCKQFRAQFKLWQVKSHVQTARESHDLNMDFCSFDNVFKQLLATNSMQELLFILFMLYLVFVHIGTILISQLGALYYHLN